MDSHPRFAEGIEALRAFQAAVPPALTTSSSLSPTSSSYCRPHIVQRSLSLLSPSETAELHRLTSLQEAIEQRIRGIQQKLSNASSEGRDGEVHTDDVSSPSSSPVRSASKSSHSDMLNAVWKMFYTQLRDGGIQNYHDTQPLQDAMQCFGVQPST